MFNGIDINITDNVLYCDNKIVAIIENPNDGIDMSPINIKGTPSKLHNLGWVQQYSLNDIINDINN